MKEVQSTVLICDDEQSIREAFMLVLQDDYRVLTVATGEAALKKVTDDKVDLVFLDIRMPGMNGIETLGKIKKIDPNIPVVMVTAVNDVQKASEATALGSYNYIVKPFNVDEMLNITRELLSKKKLLEESRPIREMRREGYRIPQLVGQTRRIQELRDVIPELAGSSMPLCLVGEMGTEKQVVAELLHRSGDRKDFPFQVFSDTGLSERLLRTKLFGVESGVFATGLKRQLGLIEVVNHGTIFIDHVEKLSITLQQELVNLLTEHKLTRQGGENAIPVDVRFLFGCAPGTSAQLDPQFFETVMQTAMEIPPLRERTDDLALLVRHYLEEANRTFGKTVHLAEETLLPVFEGYPWPGNVDELKGLMERLVFFSQPEGFSPWLYFPLAVFSHLDFSRFPTEGGRFSLEDLSSRLESLYLNQVREQVKEPAEVARLLGINLNALRLKCEQLNIPLSF